MNQERFLPQPVSIGIKYYMLRHQDYVARHTNRNASTLQSPDYYLAYGDKYCRRFRLEARRQFSSQGQAWVDKTCEILQQTLEQKRIEDLGAFARLEENAAAFRSFAYSTHAQAYIQGGIAALPLRDLILIMSLIDVKDLVNFDGLFQVLQVLIYLLRTYIRRVWEWRKTFDVHSLIVLAGQFLHRVKHIQVKTLIIGSERYTKMAAFARQPFTFMNLLIRTISTLHYSPMRIEIAGRG